MTWIRKNDQDPTESGSDNNMILSKNDQDPAESGSDNNMSLSVLL